SNCHGSVAITLLRRQSAALRKAAQKERRRCKNLQKVLLARSRTPGSVWDRSPGAKGRQSETARFQAYGSQIAVQRSHVRVHEQLRRQIRPRCKSRNRRGTGLLQRQKRLRRLSVEQK